MAEHTWTVGELIAKLQDFPISTQVYLQDADSGWTIHLFKVETGRIKSANFVSAKAVLISPSDYSAMDSSIEFERDR